MGFDVNEDYVRERVIPSLLGRSSRFANVLPSGEIALRIAEAKAEVEQCLSIRFEPTTFKGWMGPGARPSAPAPSSGTEATEYESAYTWPTGPTSRSGFLAWKLNVRPVIEVLGGKLVLPGGREPGIAIDSSWFRVEALGEVILMPGYGASPLALPGMPFGIFDLMSQRVPSAMLWEYRAGLQADDWRRYPSINRLVALKAAISLLPAIAAKANPSGATSKSGDGLTLSWKSGYALADLDERLKNEADALLSKLQDAFGGTSELAIL